MNDLIPPLPAVIIGAEDFNRIVARAVEMARAAEPCRFRNVYTPEEFVSEILCGKRHVHWVQAQIRAKKIKAFPGSPALIPQSEAIRFTTAGK